MSAMNNYRVINSLGAVVDFLKTHLVDGSGDAFGTAANPIHATIEGITVDADIAGMARAIEEGTASAGGAATLTDAAKSWGTNQWAGYLIRIWDGTSEGDVRTIASNTATQITVSANWTATPTTSTDYEIFETITPNLDAIEAAVQIMDDWDESDRAKVNPIVGQAGIAAGAGAVGATVPRVTHASDDPAVTALQIMDDWDSSDRCKVIDYPVRGAIIAHRAAITSADKVVSPTLVTIADQAGVVGVMAAVAHGAAVAAGNTWGTAGTSNIVTVTPTLNKTVDLTIPQATGATYYDIFFSTATTAPLWVARVTEAERAAGCAITAVGTVGAGGAAGIVNIRLVGTGIANTNAVFAQNNAYTPATPTAIDCTGYKRAYVNVKLAVTDLRSAPTLNVIPFLSRNEGSPAVWYQGKQQILQPLAALGYCQQQGFELDVDGAKGLVVLVGTVSGQGASVQVDVELV